MSCSAILTSPMCWKRRCGSFRKHRRISFSRSLGTAGMMALGAFGCARITALRVSAVDVPANARVPVTIS
jgi:hypothetical protein